MTKTVRFLLILALGLLSASAAFAEEPAAAPERAPYAVGSGTDVLLAAQRDGRRAGKALPIPATEAEPSRKRYLDSFSRPIPEQLLPQQTSTGTAAK